MISARCHMAAQSGIPVDVSPACGQGTTNSPSSAYPATRVVPSVRRLIACACHCAKHGPGSWPSCRAASRPHQGQVARRALTRPVTATGPRWMRCGGWACHDEVVVEAVKLRGACVALAGGERGTDGQRKGHVEGGGGSCAVWEAWC